MTSDSASSSEHDFFQIAGRLNYLDNHSVPDLAREAAERSTAPSQLVLQRGLMDATQVDIVESLTRPTELLPGYEILDVLGSGGMGVVYRATQLSLDRPVAVKTILVNKLADASTASRFEQEAKAVAKLRHPNIVAAYDFGRVEGRLFLAMELLDGRDVEQLIRDNGQLGEATTWGIIRQTAAALSHACRSGIIHRDIKPSNLLLIDAPEGADLPPGLAMVKVADFGLALLVSDEDSQTRLTADNTALGTPHYMAPEQVLGQPVDLRSDIYALGATAFHMLAGRPPFAGYQTATVLTRKVTEDVASVRAHRPDVSKATVDLVQQMLAREPDQRPADYTLLLNRIDEAVRQSGDDEGSATVLINQINIPEAAEFDTASDTRSRTAAMPAPTRRSRWLLPAGSLAAIALIGFVVARMFPVPDSQSTVAMESADEFEPSGWGEPLFDGKSVELWPPVSGQWIPGTGDNRGYLIGSDGTVRRPLFRPGDPDPVPLRHYRLTFVVELTNASSVDLEFGITGPLHSETDRYVLRLTDNSLAVGQRTANGGKFTADTGPIGFEQSETGPRAITLERLSRSWSVLVAGMQVAQVAFDGRRELPEIRLAVNGGDARFSDISVSELQPVADLP